MLLGKYELRRELGKGAMGVVYEGFDSLIQRIVAIKVIRADRLDDSVRDGLLGRLRREAQAAGRLNHPNIVGVHDFGEARPDGGSPTPFIVMEFVQGRDLAQRFAAGERFDERAAVALMRGVLAALQHAHERGVVHRDIKPGNIIVLDDGSVKVADFGVARIEASELTQTGTVIGTPTHMSPEQWLGQGADARSDQFACGVLLYQLLTGELPFTGSPATVMHKVLHQDPVPSTVLNPRLGPAWDDVLRRALARNPNQRFPSAAAMSAALGAAADADDRDATIIRPARPRGTAARADIGAPGRSSDPSVAPLRIAKPVAIVAAACAIAAAAIVYVRSRPADAPAPPARTVRAASENGLDPRTAPAGVGAMRPTEGDAATASPTAASDTRPATGAVRSRDTAPLAPPASGAPIASNGVSIASTGAPLAATPVAAPRSRPGKDVGKPTPTTERGGALPASVAAARIAPGRAAPVPDEPAKRPVALAQGPWAGKFRCAALLDASVRDTAREPFTANVRIDVSNRAITFTRGSDDYVETLSGAVDDAGHWSASGLGRRTHGTGRWRTYAAGTIDAGGAPSLTGVVTILSNDNRMVRRCTVDASPGAAPPR